MDLQTMKKTIMLTAAVLLLAVLASCGRQDKPTAASTVPAGTEETLGATDGNDAAAVRERFVGVWHLAETNDLEALNGIFPNVSAFGSSLEIRSDGMISWYIGADGAVGSYEIRGTVLTTDVVDELDGESYHVTLGLQGTDELIMSFKDTVLAWSYGDEGSLQGEEG